jgi:hypothetical protein
MGKRFGLQRWTSTLTQGAGPGWRLALPVWLFCGRRYDVQTDEFVVDWWAWTLAFHVARLSNYGAMLRVTWGVQRLYVVHRAPAGPEPV